MTRLCQPVGILMIQPNQRGRMREHREEVGGRDDWGGKRTHTLYLAKPCNVWTTIGFWLPFEVVVAG